MMKLENRMKKAIVATLGLAAVSAMAIKPNIIDPQLDHARAELETAYGMASSGWKKEEGKIVMDVVVPPNTTATIEFPNGRKMETGSPARSAGWAAKKRINGR
jgi:hypothetical protein